MQTRAVALPVAAALVIGAVATPALASHSPARPAHDKATNVVLKAGRSTVAPKHKASLTATLKSANHRVAGEDLWLESRDAASHKFGNAVDIGATDAKSSSHRRDGRRWQSWRRFPIKTQTVDQSSLW